MSGYAIVRSAAVHVASVHRRVYLAVHGVGGRAAEDDGLLEWVGTGAGSGLGAGDQPAPASAVGATSSAAATLKPSEFGSGGA